MSYSPFGGIRKQVGGEAGGYLILAVSQEKKSWRGKSRFRADDLFLMFATGFLLQAGFVCFIVILFSGH
jgi:hypothetical protein